MNLRVILALAVLATLVFLAIKLVPPYINNYQFQDDLITVARYNTYAQNKTEADIRQEVLGKARELGLPVTEEQIAVEKSSVGVNIDVKYTVVVPVPGYTFNLKFNPQAGNKMITAR